MIITCGKGGKKGKRRHLKKCHRSSTTCVSSAASSEDHAKFLECNEHETGVQSFSGRCGPTIARAGPEFSKA
ncbi:unnamed protein product [Prunus armeniaca]|uniref:Uncharacterized protein n=1 Tax=Prunus armeniaca TaxID=36596 RepID=A0A6J5XBC8_PRUAR|nr:unnamed protein product [Prunus armeniaca]CAB4309205.1 unnamed protein product [Prunus armeniaca]